jgi:DNA recombination protein RmuC
MSATFVAGIVLAMAIGVALGALMTALWYRSQPAPLPAPAPVATTPVADPGQPVAEALARIESQIREVESKRQHMLGGLEHHLTSLSRETVALSQALRAPNSRGRWGELTLRRVAELAGMVAQCDFFEQQSDGGARPDMIVRLPGGRTLAVDAKVPLAAYLDAEAAPDEASRNLALDRHAQQVSRHVNVLSAREYWAQLQPAPEMVVLFMAGDHFLSAALERDPELLERALARRVLLATPVTLVSVLKGVSYGWKQERLAQNAGEIRRIAGEFYDRIRIFAESYTESGRQLAKAVEAYNRSAGSWDARMLPSLKRMRELGAGAGDDAAVPAQIDTAIREPQAPGREPQVLAAQASSSGRSSFPA